MTNKVNRPNFADVKAASLKEIDRVLSHWLPNGKRVDGGKEYTAPNPTRADKRAGSLKINLSTGTWRFCNRRQRRRPDRPRALSGRLHGR